MWILFLTWVIEFHVLELVSEGSLLVLVFGGNEFENEKENYAFGLWITN